MKIQNNFFAILSDGEVKKINLAQNVVPRIRDVFISNSVYLFQDNFEQIEFDGNYTIQDEEVLFVRLTLPNDLLEAPNNPIGLRDLDLVKDQIKTLFWYENSTYYFQSFDRRKLLKNKNVLFFDKNTFDQLKQDAFILDNTVSAIYKDEKFFFKSYANANKIFSLLDFFEEATNEVLGEFCNAEKVLVDRNWLLANSNTLIRKHIALIQNSKILTTANTTKIQKSAKKFNLSIELEDGKIKFPENIQMCKSILYYLNEHYYLGIITGNKYRTNSKKSA